MQTMALLSPSTRQPTMLIHGVMKNKQVRKVMLGGYTHKKYKYVRKLLKVMEEKELGIRFKK